MLSVERFLQLPHRHPHQHRQRPPASAEVHRRRLIPPAAAVHAQRVAAVAAQQHADVHLVALRLQPREKPLHPVPQPVFPKLLASRLRILPVDHPVLLGLRQLVKGAHRVDVLRPRAAHEVALAFRAVLGLERLHHSHRDAERRVGDRPQDVQPDGAPEAATRRTRALRVIETEQARRRRRDVGVAVRAMPACRKRQELMVDG